MMDDGYNPDDVGVSETWQRSLDEAAKRELLLLGEGQLVYFRPVNGEEYEAGEQATRPVSGLGVFSARGNLLTVCHDLESAITFAMDNNQVPVRLH